jgi:hypothetical protein
VEVHVALPVHPFEEMAEEERHVGGGQAGMVVLGDDEQVLRQRELSLSQDRIRLREQLLRLAPLGEGDVAFAADGEE